MWLPISEAAFVVLDFEFEVEDEKLSDASDAVEVKSEPEEEKLDEVSSSLELSTSRGGELLAAVSIASIRRRASRQELGSSGGSVDKMCP